MVRGDVDDALDLDVGLAADLDPAGRTIQLAALDVVGDRGTVVMLPPRLGEALTGERERAAHATELVDREVEPAAGGDDLRRQVVAVDAANDDAAGGPVARGERGLRGDACRGGDRLSTDHEGERHRDRNDQAPGGAMPSGAHATDSSMRISTMTLRWPRRRRMALNNRAATGCFA